MRFNNKLWEKWERRFAVLPKRSVTGRWIWGKVMVRRNIFMIHEDGTAVIEYATYKEAFKDNLKNG